ncbi:MAG: DUF1802 family protein [Hydrococcus sp. C42_A2020_068]|uniref:DUF1802 family protein n=1 Tax=Pleurocapsa sp. PCC 7327 TaxID=118163 RepID=UPI00029FC2F7|nr:DUF1802 family protein [Pleurocapsa sp. PCC 7327]AFY77732.1 hypothetical protein Ple7327_2433 [Pleurocapsa sp. PCC 7327]MBF2021344.1 DUF1802 family protein [Hydrococcus sp. C42_A2020_068]
MPSTTHALKEWAVAVNALEAGKTIMLLRKGGIREVGARFQVRYERALLYPTYEHQKPYLLKPEYAGQVTPVASGWHPQTVRIGSWAEISNVFCVSEASVVDRLLPYHIWNERLASDRFNWKPRQPLYVLLLRVYRLPQPQMVSYSQEYGGCKSWIELLQSIPLEGSLPVLDESQYEQRVEEIREIVTQSPEFSNS